MDNRTITSSRFFSKKNLFSPPRLVLFLCLLLVGALVPNKAYALSSTDLAIKSSTINITWSPERAAFYVEAAVYVTTSSHPQFFDLCDFYVNGDVWVNIEGREDETSSAYISSRQSTSTMKIIRASDFSTIDYPGSGKSNTFYSSGSGNTAKFWIYPVNPDQNFEIKVSYKVKEDRILDRTYTEYNKTIYTGKPTLYNYTPSLTNFLVGSDDGRLTATVSSDNVVKYTDTKSTVYLESSLDGSTYKTYASKTFSPSYSSWDFDYAMLTNWNGSVLTQQEFANGVYVRVRGYSTPDNTAATYYTTNYSTVYHTGATQVIKDKVLNVTQNGAELALTWDVLKPSNTETQDVSDYQIERYVDGNWEVVTTVACNTTVSSYSYTYTLSSDEREKGSVTYIFRVWKKRFNDASVRSDYMTSESKSISVNTDYKAVTFSNISPNTSTQTATLSWSVGTEGVWSSDVTYQAVLADLTYGGSKTFTTGYNATSIDVDISGCTAYSIELQVTVNGVVVGTMGTETFETSDDGDREISSLVVSKGYYNTYVRINWTVPANASDFDYFNISRRDKTTGTVTNVDQLTHSGLTSYSYQDYGMDAGTLYEYTVEGYSNCMGSATLGASISTTGYSQPYGTVSGRIAYDSSQGVEGVSVSASSDDASASNKSLYFLGNDAASNVTLPDTLLDFTATSAYTVQFWVNPSAQSNTSSSAASSVYLLSKEGTMSLKLYDYSYQGGESNRLYLDLLGSSTITDIALTQDAWSHITYSALLSSDQSQAYAKVYINGELSKTYTFEVNPTSIEQYKDAPFMMGSDADGEEGFRGYIDELRIYNAELDSATIAKNYNIFLTGKESDLLAYYRCDELGSDELFDISATGTQFHMLDGLIETMVNHSTIVPTADQLSIKAYTDSDGNYLLNTIPYTSEGIQYNIIPTLGVHEFSPNKRPIYVSPESVVFNSIDFEDVSSFPVSGVVYYENTDVPVEGVELYVDGVICSSNGDIITTDATGKFTISVPIGDHYITVKKTNHTFTNDGRYPTDANNVGTLYTFNQEMSGLTFSDNTLVVVAGRVVGGEIETAKPLGLAQSVNNIGTATIQLSSGSYRMNVLTEVDGTTVSYEDNPDNLAIAAATTATNSTAYRKGGNNEDVKYIYITTDSVTGEFSAMLPPLAYTIEDVYVASNSGVSFSNLSTIDASTPGLTTVDSVEYDDGTVESFEYVASMILTHRESSSFSVTDAGNTVGAYGADEVDYSDLSATETVPMYSVDGSGNVTYAFGAPVFVKGVTYTFDLYGYEEYSNYDTDANNPTTDRVPLQYSLVTITNEMSDGQSVYVEDGTTDDGVAVEQGDLAALAENQLELDSLGMATYSWTAGYPNITAPYTRGISIVYEVNGANVAWDGNTTFEGVVLGDMPSGNNFVTSGPDEVLMILRDPAGSNSYAYWEAGQTITKEVFNSGSASVGQETSVVVSLGTQQNIIAGTPATGTITTIGAVMDVEAGVSVEAGLTISGTNTTTTTTTKTISTSDNEDYVGAHGDVFVGTATNIIFGNARNVGLTRDAYEGTYSIELEDVITTGSEFGTAFNYTQYYIEEVLIPNLYLNRNALLETVVDVDAVTNTTSEEAIYVTTLTSDDERFGSKNTDVDIWGSSASSLLSSMSGPSYTMLIPTGANYDITEVYQDMVQWYNTQIVMWEMTMAANEEAKVTVIDERETYLSENISFDQGVSVESSASTCSATAVMEEWTIETVVSVGLETGGEVNTTGVTLSSTTTIGACYSGSNTDTEENCSTTGFALSDDGLNDALSIDVFNAPDGYGAIFVTRGGQTSCPFEDATYTKYYEPGTEIGAATMQVEIPVIESDIYYATDVPAGGTATFNIEMRNDSETGDDVWFDLKVVDATNANGASLSVDGSKLTEEGRSMLVPAGGSLTKALQLTQTQEDVLDYENIALVLVSQCQYDPTGIFPVIADTIYLSAQFVPTCSDITLTIAETTMNMFTSDTLAIQMTDFDRTYNTFESIRLQYKYANDADWTLANEYVLDEEDVTSTTELLPTGGIVTVQLPMSNTSIFPDGTYQFRLQTTCEYGTDGVYTESETITVTKDMTPPTALGTPNPSDGILSAGDDISIIFNEDIRNGSLTDANNFIVTGTLNDAAIDHAVAMRLDGVDYPVATTEADVHLANSSFAFDTWLNYDGTAGTILEHGSATNKFVVAINASGNLVVTVGETVITSSGTVPTDTWCFLSMNYAVGEISNTFTAIAASDATTANLFTAEVVPTYTGTGTLALGEGLKGAMHELTLWNTARSTVVAQSEMYTSKAASTLNLIGYWKLDEGYGTSALDGARSRHMTLAAASWYLYNDNIAAELDGNAYLELDISTVSAGSTDDYMMEMWFKGAAQTDAALFGAESKLAIMFNDNGYLTLLQDDVETVLSTTNYLDDTWHHIALNVLRSGYATVYVDGVAVKQIANASVETLQGSDLIIGAIRTSNTSGAGGNLYTSYFEGEVDELRYWVASLNGTFIAENRYNRVSIDDVAGLNAYYPFEIEGLDDGNQVVTVFSLADASENAVGDADIVNVVETATAPALQEAPTVTNLQYSYVASEREIVISLLDEPYRLEGTTVNFTVRNVRDNNNNLMDPVNWSAYINCNRLVWEESAMSFEQLDGEAIVFTATVSNLGSDYENWAIAGIPTWMSASATSGALSPLSTETITFTINSDMAIGSYEEVLYLYGNDEIYVSLPVALSVKSEAPDWSVNPADFENSMAIMGTLSIQGVLSYDAEDIVAAFIGETCVGLESPAYNSRYDAYFVMMDVYGNTEHQGQEVTFKAWDASTGNIHPVVTTSADVTFVSDNIIGSINSPFTWNAESYVEQTINVTSGWNWISLGVNPADNTVAEVFATVTDNASIVKNQSVFAQATNGTTWSGTLTEVDLSSMYRLQMNAEDVLRVSGSIIEQDENPITVGTGWSWIAYSPLFNLTVADAFADLNPETGDVVKSISGFAIYQDYEWIGKLTTLEPGVGYMYMSVSSQSREFTYPSSSAYTTANLMMIRNSEREIASSYSTVNDGQYSGNMTMVAVVMEGETTVANADVAVIAGEECRASQVSGSDGLLYLTIHGDGAGTALTFEVVYNDETYTIDQELLFVDNDHYGSPDEPYVIQLVAPTGIKQVSADAISIYPNPAKDIVYVETAIEYVSMSVSSAAGAILYETTSPEATLDFSGYAEGVYFVILVDKDGNTYTERVIKK